jgi:phosphoglycolate phosphatase
MYSTIVYDLDGTLVDSAATVAGLLNALRTEHGLSPLERCAYTPWLSIGGNAMVAAALGIPESDAPLLLADFRARYEAVPTDPATLYPAVHKTLSKLKAAGIRLGLCTNKPRPLTDKILTDTGLGKYFGTVCAGLDLPTAKPHPENLRVCLKALGSRPESTIVVGDSRVDQLLAEACGTDFAFFSVGYDDGVRQEACTMILQDHEEIYNLFSLIEKRPHRE